MLLFEEFCVTVFNKIFVTCIILFEDLMSSLVIQLLKLEMQKLMSILRHAAFLSQHRHGQTHAGQ